MFKIQVSTITKIYEPHKKTGKYGSYKRQKESKETVPREAFKSAIINIFKELRKTMPKELIESMSPVGNMQEAADR